MFLVATYKQLDNIRRFICVQLGRSMKQGLESNILHLIDKMQHCIANTIQQDRLSTKIRKIKAKCD